MGEGSQNYGERIKSALKSCGMTQRSLAKALNLSESSVSGYVTGDTEPSVFGWRIISELCNVSLDWLITGSEHQAGPPEITTEMLAAELMARPQLRDQVEQRIRDQIREETIRYGPHAGEEERLLESWRVLTNDQKRMILRCVEEEAKESRGKEKQEDGSQSAKSA